jgi:hypothetical protein
MLKDDVIYHLGRIEKMRQKIERKIQTLILDNADDAREGFRIIGEDADRLEGEAVALTEIAEEAGFFESDPASSREAFETIALEADSIEATAMDVFGMLEEMEGEEGDEVQEVVDDYLCKRLWTTILVRLTKITTRFTEQLRKLKEAWVRALGVGDRDDMGGNADGVV